MDIKVACSLLVITSAISACGSEPAAAPTIAPAPGGESTTAPAVSAGDAAAGQAAFVATCAACHGPDATGVEGLGKNLHANTFVQERTDDELLAFLKTGRPASDPLNTTGVDMPPKGGNPALKDEDLLNIVAYMRSIGVKPD